MKYSWEIFVALWLLSTPLVFCLTTLMIRDLLGLVATSFFQESDLTIFASWSIAGVLGVCLTGIYLLAVPFLFLRNF